MRNSSRDIFHLIFIVIILLLISGPIRLDIEYGRIIDF